MQNPSARAIVLASASPYRRALLDRFLDDYQAVSPDIDESNADQLKPKALALHLARKKAETVSMTARKSLIIGADQLAVLDGQVLGKPGDHARAAEQLRQASGRAVQFLTGVCVVDTRHDTIDVDVVRVEVGFRNLDERTIEAYLARDRPYDCAGAIRVERAGPALLEYIRTDDPSALIGLPLIRLTQLLAARGFDVLSA